MMVYKFYGRDETGEEHLIGVRAERRKSPERITQESILAWGRQIAGIGFPHGIYFAAVAVRLRLPDLRNSQGVDSRSI